MDSEEFHTKFLTTLQEKLPVTFRINSGEVGFEKVSSLLRDKDFIESYSKKQEDVTEETKD